MTATYDAYPTPDARPSHTQDPTSVSTQHVEKPLPAGWKLVDAKEAEVNQGETPWVDPALAAIAENSAGEVSGALAHDKWHGMDNESPIEPVYEEIIDKRIRAAKIAGGIAAIAIGAGITLGIGAIKYEVGTTTGTAHDPIIPGNSIAIGDHGLPGLAY